jgi:hypothetical protein
MIEKRAIYHVFLEEKNKLNQNFKKKDFSSNLRHYERDKKSQLPM